MNPDLARMPGGRKWRTWATIAGAVLVAAAVAAIWRWGRDGVMVVASAVVALATAALVWFTVQLVRATADLGATTGDLVVATEGLGTTTGQLVSVTQALVDATERLQTEPAIAAVLTYDATNVFFELHNVGDGAAVNVEVEIRWHTDIHGTSLSTTKWSAQVLYPGKRVRFNPPPMKEGAHMQGEALGLFERITVDGSMHNARGAWQPIHVSIEKPQEHWDGELEARRQYTSNYEPDEITAAELKLIRKALEKSLAHPPT